MTVLILARDLDPSADAMVTALRDRGTPMCRVNTAWFPAQLSVSAGLRRGRWSGYLRTPAHCVELEDVHAVWYRSPEAYQMPDALSEPERHHAFLEAKYGLGGVLSSLSAFWVNHPARMADAAYKPVQLVRAGECGLTVPDTVITNEADTVRCFAAEGHTITKLLGSNTISEEGTRKLSWTGVLGEDDLADLRGIEVTTHMVQRWVPKAFEARVIVMGEHMTVVAIHAGNAASYVDWRSDYDALTYDVIEPPAAVSKGIHSLMRAFGLVYGALDFVVTPSGEWVFLEINPGGQYGWIEAATGVPLTSVLADLLTEGRP
ncbi:ATP-grasp ribosomal peptide maturase [Saccharopolyspora pogona]|uniref:ATP-grasp ribosomal peptide maturase n=1 Tax=Saccharopolyspora pogona TaxID=333966 RepID=UPI001688253A|nr:ATP-grasp ribosomal peptide maturase [Saccharopolyspora pogona]